jgi:F-type H+-transporting ATPase subunit b
MPQIVQLPLIFASQLFWLVVVFGIIYFVIAKGMVPKIQSVVEDRDRKIADDLAAAQKAREQAETSEGVYRERIEAGRSEALKVAQEAKTNAALDTEKKLKAVDEKVGTRIAEAQARIRAAADQRTRHQADGPEGFR